jgi:4'-phosphopantetheinyl transferase
MKDGPPAVLRWPAAFDKAQDLLIVAVDTKNTPIRESARQRVRSVLREILGDVELISIPGQPIRLTGRDSPVGISVSHEKGLSLLAVRRSGPVGIDLLRTPDSADWQTQIPRLALDYLGPKLAQRIAGLPHEEQMAQFAQAWTEHEASLKCQGRALEEWSAALEENLSPCCVQQLALPAGYVGALATRLAT